ncbi:MAG: GntR family transcriptional regulator [Paracoccus sp. (in: a-proteobacteria)]|uniref:GntR family transcriptional regulator n=1 Tax=Paracoccus sp. TaxID=267 RepID=UPI0026E1002F|nr:GntR family transcriptional regulator [Paracoccus sp. (in: a-proteobacteria)]MDO5623021.1 GntR family transcriptional regulator [Paracoccus sp. (in: a-proteobacteria)]
MTGIDIHDDMRRRIMTLELPPGSILSRQDLQDQYGVSSTPIRDMLLKLQEGGLIEMLPQSRTSVSLIDIEQARQAHFLRNAAEQAVVAQLAKEPSLELIGCLTDIIALQEQHAASDLAIFAVLDSRFHQELFRAANMMRVHNVIRRESMHIDRIRALHLPVGNKSAQILADHRLIVRSLAAGDGFGAVAAMAEHLSQSIAIALELHSKMPEYFKG